MSHPALQPGRIGPLALRNRIIRTATYEGMTPGGRVSDALIEHHAGFARRGVGLSIVAYGAVASAGRTFDDQLLVDAGAADGLKRLADAVHAEGGAVCLQLAHCGGFSKLPGHGAPRGPSAALNPYGLAYGLPRIRAMSHDDIEQTTADYVRAAVLARDAGFDALELHCGHGYLLSQFLSPRLNKRRDEYGGDLQGRLRFPLQVVAAIREAVGPDLCLLAKLNLNDGISGGSDEADAVHIAQALESAGVNGLIPSGGLVQRTAFYLLRGGVPIKEMAGGESSILQRWAMRAFAPFLVKPYAYTSTFLFDGASQVLDAVQVPVALLGGVDSVAALDRAFDRGFPFVVMGRALLADPDFVERLTAGERVVSRCDHCNLCVAEMDRGGVRCVL
jgi:2,4-dienoyl-CoA reductase-like NADH-dependent reductase (Old Yellow Enzyme family)